MEEDEASLSYQDAVRVSHRQQLLCPNGHIMVASVGGNYQCNGRAGTCGARLGTWGKQPDEKFHLCEMCNFAECMKCCHDLNPH